MNTVTANPSFSCFLPLSPTAKQRPRFTKKGIAFTPAATRRAEGELKYFLLQEHPPKFEGPLAITLTFHLLRPKSAKKRTHPNVRPDIDNYVKQIFDASNGILFEDDASVVELIARKIYDDKEGITIAVSEIG